MKIVVAPDSFKGSVTAKEAAESIKKGIQKACKDIEVVCVPMADGGEGTVQSMVDATGGEIFRAKVKGPLLEEVEAFYGVLGDGVTAVIEMAAASGLPLMKEGKKNPMLTSTYGTGELIRYALDKGCRNIIMGIGGSATNDGGIGMAKALGVRFLDKKGADIGNGGASLARLDTIDVSQIDSRIKDCKFILACDVDNPLYGPNGASYVFGPQKGATPEMIKVLDRNLEHYAKVVQKCLGIDISLIPGGGAAGGLGGGSIAFLGASLHKGAEIVINMVKLEEHLKDADLVITGEGRIDYQTQYGKTPFAVAKISKKYGIPVAALVGQIGKGAESLYTMGIDSMFTIVEGPTTFEDSLSKAPELLQRAAERLIRLYKIRK